MSRLEFYGVLILSLCMHYILHTKTFTQPPQPKKTYTTPANPYFGNF